MITKCPLCGKEYELSLNQTIGDITIQCSHCNTSFVVNSNQAIEKESANSSSTIIVHGYEEWFLITSKIEIYIDNQLKGKVSRKEELSIEIDKDCAIKFKNGLRSKTVNIKKGVDTHVLLAIDRFSGKLKAMVANDDNLVQQLNLREQNSRIATIATIVLIALIMIAGVLFLVYLPSFRHYI